MESYLHQATLDYETARKTHLHVCECRKFILARDNIRIIPFVFKHEYGQYLSSFLDSWNELEKFRKPYLLLPPNSTDAAYETLARGTSQRLQRIVSISLAMDMVYARLHIFLLQRAAVDATESLTKLQTEMTHILEGAKRSNAYVTSKDCAPNRTRSATSRLCSSENNY